MSLIFEGSQNNLSISYFILTEHNLSIQFTDKSKKEDSFDPFSYKGGTYFLFVQVIYI